MSYFSGNLSFSLLFASLRLVTDFEILVEINFNLLYTEWHDQNRLIIVGL